MFARRPLAAVSFALLAMATNHCAAPEPVPGDDIGGDKPVQPAPTGSVPGGPGLPPPPPPPAGCAAAAKGLHPADDACLISSAYGVFVSSSAPAGGSGTQAAPFNSYTLALAALKNNPSAQRNRIFVCAEEYREPTIELVQATSSYGYFDCKASDSSGRWSIKLDRRAKMLSTSTIAVRAKGLTSTTRIEAMQFQAADAAAAGASSYGLWAEQSSGLSFIQVRVAGGRGGDGVDGASARQLVNDASAKGEDGRASAACGWVRNANNQWLQVCGNQNPAAGGTNTCGGAVAGILTVPGGAGGANTARVISNGAFVPFGSSTRTSGAPAYGFLFDGGASGGSYDGNSNAASGAVGRDGKPGTNGKATLGASGFVFGNGVRGSDGDPGRGGGGGGGGGDSTLPGFGATNGERWMDVAGSGGGAGGCPGLAGEYGSGGGASVGVFSIESSVNFDKSEIVAATGGRAGRGNAGSASVPGGLGGRNFGFTSVNAGASGGRGGYAGWSGHGAAGPSYNFAFSGSEPTRSVCTSPLAVAAAGQPALSNADGVTVPAAPAGDVAVTYTF